MQGWTKIAVAALPIAVLLVLLVVFIQRWCSSKQRRHFTETKPTKTQVHESLESGITRRHLAYEMGTNHKGLASFHDHLDLENKRSKALIRRGSSVKPLFNWADHPSLVTEAVEHGWSRFAFTGYTSSPPARSALLGLCAPCDQGREKGVEISWEVCPGSADFMQKMRLNSGLKKPNISSGPCVIKTALPLPGPPLGNSSSFPQEAYFEITILSFRGGDADESERTKLIRESIDGNAKSDSLVGESKEETKSELVLFSLGLTVGGSLPSKLPGTYPGSIGFNSDGSVYLDGIKLVFETGKAEWGSTETVIGCGFSPSQKVFFTVGSELRRVIHCKSEEFSTPLYPTLAANMDVVVLVNFGQSAFKYAPANAQRTANPCFIGPLASAPAAALGYEDSRELFSMGRIDAEWLNRCTTKSSHNTFSDKGTLDLDEESETELFEIVLDNWKSPTQTAWNKV